MNKKVKTILITIIVFVLVFMGAKFISKELDDMCGNDIKQKISSPNGENVAYIFERSCGATTGFSPQLSILEKDDKFKNKSGNTFRANKDFSIEWLDNKHLKVIYHKSSETYKMEKKSNGIEIEYMSQ
ncbi:DUF5412 family protein [Metabacillus fastidiosus]|uniref:DUF5412 family protein n=1 Tax=Metabacillus fastidiosus TaxID=1458 RepID=A0ABU6NU08_9BACI|nr:DUF5412 family protein [Metabacillus fastidiosus]MED4400078.1 DUF5412 family protein [Metabacillus fastidiosus]MED4452062.1 DUF5412 family protein [Metabacillus fastidiosus]MED4462564.1 DUF5412 family protein [Metabacillus fastidiosus]